MRTKLSIPLLTLLVGINIGLGGRTLFPEPVTMENFKVSGTAWTGQKVKRLFGPDEIMIRNEYTYIPMEKALQNVPEDLGRRDLARKYILRGYVNKP